jgi:hypothetical protein
MGKEEKSRMEDTVGGNINITYYNSGGVLDVKKVGRALSRTGDYSRV